MYGAAGRGQNLKPPPAANQRKRYVVDRDELVEVEFGPQEDIGRYRPI
jgi:hypothetical protein